MICVMVPYRPVEIVIYDTLSFHEHIFLNGSAVSNSANRFFYGQKLYYQPKSRSRCAPAFA